MAWWSLALFAFGVAVGSHSVLCRINARSSIVAKFLVVGTVVGLALVRTATALWAGRPETVTTLLVYAFLCEMYLFLFTLANSSVSASILLTLAAVSEASEAELEARYSSRRMVFNRLKKLEMNGFLEVGADGGYRVTRKGRVTIRLFEALRRFFRHA